MSINYSNSHWNGKRVILGETEIELSNPANLLVGFHGAESTPENMLIYGNKLKLNNTLLAFPEGPTPAGNDRWSWWQDGPKQKESVIAFLEHTSLMLDGAQKHIQEKFAETPFNICLWGFSQGAAAALVYALIGKHSLHKVGSICGFLPELPDNLAKNNTTEILGIFGSNDEVVPSFIADHALDEMTAAGHTLTARETSQGHEINGDNLKELSAFINSE